jgi:hypothetical protein
MLLNLKSSAWGLAAEGEAFGTTIAKGGRQNSLGITSGSHPE